MSSTKFACVNASYVTICTVAGTVVTIGNGLALTSGYLGYSIAAMSATVIACGLRKSSDSTGYCRALHGVGDYADRGNLYVKYITDPLSSVALGTVALDEFRVMTLWGRSTATTAIKVGAFFMRGTYSRLYFYSSGLRFSPGSTRRAPSAAWTATTLLPRPPGGTSGSIMTRPTRRSTRRSRRRKPITTIPRRRWSRPPRPSR